MLALRTLDGYILRVTEERDDAEPGSLRQKNLQGRVCGLRAARRMIAAGKGDELGNARQAAYAQTFGEYESGIVQWWYGVESGFYTAQCRGETAMQELERLAEQERGAYVMVRNWIAEGLPVARVLVMCVRHAALYGNVARNDASPEGRDYAHKHELQYWNAAALLEQEQQCKQQP